MRNQRNHTRRHVARMLALASLLSAVTLLLSSAISASAQTVGASWSYTGNLNNARQYHTATLLLGGKVLVAGGYSNDDWLSSAELYDSATGRWSNTGNLNLARLFHTATLLSNGKVLVAGGKDSAFDNTLKSTELYDPVTETWSNTGNLNEARETPTATLLRNGKVLVAGG